MKQFYYAPFEKPFLNFSNDKVISEFTKIIKYYVSEGVSGVRLRNVPYLLVDPNFEDEKNIAKTPGYHHHQYGFYTNTKTENIPTLGKLLNIWRNVVRNLTVDGPFMATDELSKLESYKIDNKLVIDLPLKTHVFEKPNVKFIVSNLNHTYNIDNIEWPLYKVSAYLFRIYYLLKTTFNEIMCVFEQFLFCVIKDIELSKLFVVR